MDFFRLFSTFSSVFCDFFHFSVFFRSKFRIFDLLSRRNELQRQLVGSALKVERAGAAAIRLPGRRRGYADNARERDGRRSSPARARPPSRRSMKARRAQLRRFFENLPANRRGAPSRPGAPASRSYVYTAPAPRMQSLA